MAPGRPTPAADIVRAFLGKKEGGSPRHGKRVLAVFQAFRSLGPPLTSRAEPVWFGRGILSLRVFGSVWLAELSFMAPQIVDRLNRTLGQPWVESLRFRAGTPPPWSETSAPGPKLTPDQLARVEKLGAMVGRPDVRAAVMKAAAAHLGTRPSGPVRNVGATRPALRPPWGRGRGGSSGR